MKLLVQRIILFVLRGLVKAIARLFFQVHTHGQDHIPTSGGALIVANHVSYLDFMLVLLSIPRHVSFVMNSDVYNKPILRFLFESARCIPIAPRNGKNNLELFNQTVSERINAGELVVIFAEGTVTRTGQLLEFKRGVEHISKLIQAPIIPIHIYNANGAPFSFKAGQDQMQRIQWKSWRRPVWTRIGQPLTAPSTAHQLRQTIKELEVENLQSFLQQSPDLPLFLRNAIERSNAGGWTINQRVLRFEDLPQKLKALDLTMGHLLQPHSCVALLVPKSVDAVALILWLLLRRMTIVPIPAHFSNEQQLYAMRRSKAQWLIATRDIAYTGCAPIAEQLIYMEDIIEYEKNRMPLPPMSTKGHSWQKSVMTIFKTKSNDNELALVLFDSAANHEDEMTCTSLSHQNILATLLGLRQVYFFEKNSVQLSNIPHTNANGLVMEIILPLLHDLNVHVARTHHSAADFLDQLQACQPSLTMATPSQLDMLAEISTTHNLPFLTHVFTAEATPQRPAIATLRQRGIQVFVCASFNQTSSVFAINLNNYRGLDIVGKPMEQENENRHSIGKALPGVAIKTTRPNGEECNVNENGLMWIKGPSVANMVHAASECQMRLLNGWYNSGCYAAIDHQGFILLEGASTQR